MMPRPPSPNPSPNPSYPVAFNPSVSASYERKQKQRSIMGITAGAEDVKYQAKYRELKKKVKEIESDNDRLYFKLLLAKKNIRRMNLERAILYERLAAVPPTPGRHTQELPNEQDPMFHSQPTGSHEHPRAVDPNDQKLSEYMHMHPTARIVHGPDGKVVAIEDTPAQIDARGVPVASAPPPHGIPLVHGFRHDSGPGYDPTRQLPPPPPMIPLLQQESAPEPSVTNDHPVNQQHSYPQPRPAPPPPTSHSHSNSSHRSRSSSARPDLDIVSGGTSRIEAPGAAYSVHSRSPNMPGEPQVEHRSRRHDILEHVPAHGHPVPHQHIQVPQQAPSSPPLVSPTSHHRGSTRLHNHQRIGPGAHIHREPDPDDWERRQQLEYNRAVEREEEAQRAVELKHRLEMEAREEEALWADQEARARVMSRSGSPGSTARANGSRDPSLPASGLGHDYDRPSRGHAPHVSNLLGIERDPAFKDDERNGARDRMPTSEVTQGSSVESRKRSRDDMEVDDRYDPDIRPAIEGGSTSRGSAHPGGNRGGKRSHSEDDGDAGHSGSGEGDSVSDDRMEDA